MRNRFTFCLCVLCLLAAFPSQSVQLTSSLARTRSQVPAGGGLEQFYGTIENPTDVAVYVTSVSFTSSGDWFVTEGASGLSDVERAIQYFVNSSQYGGLLIPPQTNGVNGVGWTEYDGVFGTFDIPGNPVQPVPRATQTIVMHLQGRLATDLTTVVDVGDITIVLNPYLPVVSDIDQKVYHVKAGSLLTITGQIWNSYDGTDTHTDIPSGAMYLADVNLFPGNILSQNLHYFILNKSLELDPGGTPVHFSGPYGMYILQIPKGTPSFTCRLIFWSVQVEDEVVGYADFQVIVNP